MDVAIVAAACTLEYLQVFPMSVFGDKFPAGLVDAFGDDKRW